MKPKEKVNLFYNTILEITDEDQYGFCNLVLATRCTQESIFYECNHEKELFEKLFLLNPNILKELSSHKLKKLEVDLIYYLENYGKHSYLRIWSMNYLIKIGSKRAFKSIINNCFLKRRWHRDMICDVLIDKLKEITSIEAKAHLRAVLKESIAEINRPNNDVHLVNELTDLNEHINGFTENCHFNSANSTIPDDRERFIKNHAHINRGDERHYDVGDEADIYHEDPYIDKILTILNKWGIHLTGVNWL